MGLGMHYRALDYGIQFLDSLLSTNKRTCAGGVAKPF